MYTVKSTGDPMKFSVLCLLNRPLTEGVQNRAVVSGEVEIQSLEQLSAAVSQWLGLIMREEPSSTEVLSLSHTKID